MQVESLSLGANKDIDHMMGEEPRTIRLCSLLGFQLSRLTDLDPSDQVREALCPRLEFHYHWRSMTPSI